MLLVLNEWVQDILVNLHIHSPKHGFSFNNSLYVASSKKKNVYVHKFTTCNDLFLTFHPTLIYVKYLHIKIQRQKIYLLKKENLEASLPSEQEMDINILIGAWI
jgi:hypothetical protein